MTESFNIRTLRAEYSEPELIELFEEIDHSIDTFYLPVFLKQIKLSHWDELMVGISNFMKTVQPLEAPHLTITASDLKSSVENAIENMFFDSQEIKQKYKVMLDDVVQVKTQMKQNSKAEIYFVVVNRQLDELTQRKPQVQSQNSILKAPEQEKAYINPSHNLEIQLENNSAPKQTECCAGCAIF